MPFELQIKELNDYQKAQEFINSVDNYITLNMLKKYGIRPKIGKLALRKNPNTIIAKPLVFGSCEIKNEKLYKKISNDEIISLCNEELNYMKKNRIINESNVDSYINSGLVQHMMNKYRIFASNSIIELLK